ncbi:MULTISPECIES: DUF58 domain-containing protein [Methanocorpusculum]|jgi:uncharacterized protein (DUF58 family)|uniref:DUF58 domain-containing protein n=1 Tax=Methanocorpusculum TaxID=2192 RepID=UPI000693ACB3|nr:MULTISPECIES: DUF58 domain-containing protein [Methanocorpusculum]MDD2248282.1 DUF58 domain-containing protein [Methanocorpusculum sp.]MDD2802575.1 DUF58 domain-containing protein [Methanocorpusculum sp.]MDD3046732.1 DUF58 domain-containing protein [Methanocorpusculum sp.]MDD3912032.1 DUF58 domain-containing protein [Methanocorpusculum sp.]MDY3201966.1 DUF58 domain-containing protein [Methanocorpusculum sp.]
MNQRLFELLEKSRPVAARFQRPQGMQGSYISRRVGLGTEFSELREYLSGDDVRAIDKNVTARTGIPHVRVHAEEPDLNLYIAVDLSASGHFGSGTSKLMTAKIAAASILLSAEKEHIPLGLCLFTSTVEKFIPAGSGTSHLHLLLTTLAETDAKNSGTSIQNACCELASRIQKSSSIILISDFQDTHFASGLQLLGKRHRLSALRITDPGEFTLPDVGRIILEDPESGRQYMINTSSQEVRERFSAAAKDAENKCYSIFLSSGAQYVSLSTDGSCIQSLQKLFSRGV